MGFPFAFFNDEVDALDLAVGSALVAGALSVVEPFLASLVGALVALSLVGWAMAEGPHGRSLRYVLAGRRGAGWAILSIGAGLFLFAPPALIAFRGAILAASLVPLWRAESGRSRHRVSPGARS